MSKLGFAVFLVGICVSLGAQAPSAKTHSSGLGFSYTIPSDWEVVDNQASLAAVKQQAGAAASSDNEKKGLACAELLLSARRQQSQSVIVEMALPLACFGEPMAPADLPGFAEGASEGLKQNFDLGEAEKGEYQLGTHHLWMERLKGTPKARPDVNYTIEIACGLLKKASVCWMTMAASDADLATFEHGQVSLDGEPAVALVPAGVLAHKPS